MARASFRLRQYAHDLGAGLLFVPLVFTASIAVVAFVLVELEMAGTLSPANEVFFSGDAGAAQVVLGAIAGSMMAVISIVYSVLVVALSLASMQFSPRILGGYIRDRPSQLTLGIFIGTFTYCLIVLRSIESGPGRVPTWAVNGGIVLALASIGFLIHFIHHIASGIQANHLAQRIARDTHRMIADAFLAEPPQIEPAVPAPIDGVRVDATHGGYLQLLDLKGLLAIAERHDVAIRVAASPGDFVTRGQPLAWIAPASRAAPDLVRACEQAFDLGETRTMQQDVAFGIRQLVDCALKAISPAVNDPSTAATCIDHLGDLLVAVARRHERHRAVHGRLEVPFARFAALLDLAFNQLRQYGRTDLSVSIRMLHALAAIADACRDSGHLERVELHANAIRDGLSHDFLALDRAAFDAQYASFEATAAGQWHCMKAASSNT